MLNFDTNLLLGGCSVTIWGGQTICPLLCLSVTWSERSWVVVKSGLNMDGFNVKAPSVSCCLLSTVWYLLSTSYILPSTACCHWSTACCQLCTACYLHSASIAQCCCLLSADYFLLPMTCCQVLIANSLLPVACLPIFSFLLPNVYYLFQQSTAVVYSLVSLSTAFCPMSTTNCQESTACCLLSTIYCPHGHLFLLSNIQWRQNTQDLQFSTPYFTDFT